MNCFVYIIPKECYPQYNYTCKFVQPLLFRYQHILSNLDFSDDLPRPSFGDVKIFYLCGENGDPPKNKDVCSRKYEQVARRRLTKDEFDVLSGSLQGIDTCISIAPYGFRDADSVMGSLRLLILEDNQNHPPDISRSETTTINDLGNNVDLLLERVVMGSVLDRMAVLACFIERQHMTNEFWRLGSKLEKQERVSLNRSISLNSVLQLWLNAMLESFKKRLSEHFRSAPETFKQQAIVKLTRPKKRTTQSLVEQMLEDIAPLLESDKDRQIILVISQIKQLETAFLDHLERVEKQGAVIEQLYGEMHGMVFRSNVSMSDASRDTVNMYLELDKKVAKEILNVKSVASVGYRFRTLDIFLDCTDAKLTQSVKTEVKTILSRHGLTKYAFHCEDRETTYFHQVGEKVKVGQKAGTLGGFVKLGEEQTMCILLAKHVASQGVSVYTQSPQDPEQETLFAVVRPPKVEIDSQDTDISIAQVTYKDKESCDVQFKDEDGTGLASTLFTFNNSQWLNGLPVHIWRANSQPGLGIISHPTLFRGTVPTVLLQIEDREPVPGKEKEKFAQFGDSGAIVCANDPRGNTVHVIAMFLGAQNGNSTGGNIQYRAFRLVDGLDFLQKEQKTSIALY